MKYIKIKHYFSIIMLVCVLLIFSNASQALDLGTKIPVITLKNIYGKDIKVENGNKIIVFIHYNSETCKNLLQFLNKIDKKTKDISVVAINLGPDNLGNLKKLSSKYHIQYEILIDNNMQATKAYQVLKLPTIFLVDKYGNIKKIMTGFDPNISEKIKSF